VEKNPGNLIRLLLVDDDSFVHEMVGSLIDESEYSLVSATNVVDAVKVIKNQKPDVIITDAMMPGESGFSLINRVKSDPRTQDIPIILLTILEEPNGSVMDASGLADFRVSKPLYLSNFISTLELAKELARERSETGAQVSDAPDTLTIVL
jgi:CheY-like chemotaxis protein